MRGAYRNWFDSLSGTAGRNPRDSAQEEVDVFLFYSNRLGCLVSLLLSAALTGLLILILYR